jgi:hypothetical protein
MISGNDVARKCRPESLMASAGEWKGHWCRGGLVAEWRRCWVVDRVVVCIRGGGGVEEVVGE